jgi:hypothetical protein
MTGRLIRFLIAEATRDGGGRSLDGAQLEQVSQVPASWRPFHRCRRH